MLLIESHSNDTTRVRTHLWRPEKAVDVVLNFEMLKRNVVDGAKPVTTIILAPAGMWSAFEFDHSWLTANPPLLSPTAVTWSVQDRLHKNASGSFTCAASGATTAVVLLYSTARGLPKDTVKGDPRTAESRKAYKIGRAHV